ncbi:kinesin motor domain-containing protein [Westerdykella ornata]|uniref:Kinesin-like protein n=1 Tax=Westerdykella ornata TaxID=318751 RepID=A0A6A6JS46_WESOR|nr:kinesin motor domain-containing protein [Westerdykella ornata]KAF2278688.1 kinesin motor domain-containing protein [Westerdykella ornata]
MSAESSAFRTYVRFRPLNANDGEASAFDYTIDNTETKRKITISADGPRKRTWKSGASFCDVFQPTASNNDVFNSVVAPTLPLVMEGATCNFFAYGHSGSGKTHTIIGYHNDEEKELGLCLAAARELFQALEGINSDKDPDHQGNNDKLGVAVRIYEVRGKFAYDLLNKGTQCHVREGPDGRTHVRGETEMLEGGKVRVRPIVAIPCWSFAEMRHTVLSGLASRQTGSSSIHDESSRTHAVVELEVVNKTLLALREAVIERESELVPVGKRATDVYLEENKKRIIKTADGQVTINPAVHIDQERIDEAEAEKTKYQGRLEAAENAVRDYSQAYPHPSLGGKFVFVDLAGSEYLDRGTAALPTGPKQTPQERQQGRQINTDLFTLKEVIRARASNQARTPFRGSPLTLILRHHFLAEGKGQSAMILTASPSQTQFAASMNTLKYGDLVGAASSE